MNIFKFESKRLFKPMLIWATVCILCIILFMSFYPSMSDLGIQDLVGSKLDALPESMKEAFNLSGAVDFSKLPDYTLYVMQYIAMAAGIYGGILGVSSLIKEESEGTIEFLYSKPITRNGIITSKILASLFIFTIFILLLFTANSIISLIVKPSDIKPLAVLKDVKTLYLGMFLLGIIFMSLGFLISVLIKSAKQSIPISLGIFFATYICGIAADLKENLDFLIYFSPFDYAFPDGILTNGFKLSYIILAFVIIAISIAGTYIIYNKKDFRL